MKQDMVCGEPTYQRDNLRDYRAKVNFNTTEYHAFLEGLKAIFEQNFADSMAGHGPTGITGTGPRTTLYTNLIGEIAGAISDYLQQAKTMDLAKMRNSIFNASSLSQLEEEYRNLPSMVVHPNSTIHNVGLAKEKRDALRTEIVSRFEFAKGQAPMGPKEGRDELRRLLNSYPYVDAYFDRTALTGSRLLQSTKMLEVGEWTGFMMNAKMGVIIAIIVEFSTLLMNIFLRTYSRKPAKRLMSASIRKVYFEAAALLAKFHGKRGKYTQNINGIKASAVVDIIQRARNVIRSNINMQEKVVIRDFFRGRFERMKKGEDSVETVQGFDSRSEGIYYQLESSFYESVCKSSPCCEQTGGHGLACRENSVLETYDEAVMFLVRYIVGFLERIGGIHSHDGHQWIEFDFFNEWVHMLVYTVGVHGDIMSVLGQGPSERGESNDNDSEDGKITYGKAS